uniref:Uncharacterized protein n=1 Tax=Photinus pyralis TaxID=7054 RepID=A0A1Y1KCK2_PHOPY
MFSWINSKNHEQIAGPSRPSSSNQSFTQENTSNSEKDDNESVVSKIKRMGNILEGLKIKLAVEKELLAKERMGVDCFLAKSSMNPESAEYLSMSPQNNVSSPLWKDQPPWLQQKGLNNFNPITPDPPMRLSPARYKEYIQEVERLCQAEYNNVKASISSIKRTVREDYMKGEEMLNSDSEQHRHKKHGNHHSEYCSKKHHRRKYSNKSHQVDLDDEGTFPNRYHYAYHLQNDSFHDVGVNSPQVYMREVDSDFNDIEEALLKIHHNQT